MKTSPIVRFVQAEDLAAWSRLWQGYNEFYQRTERITAEITQTTWSRLLDPKEPVYGMMAEIEGNIVGFVHYLFHRSTGALGMNCYLQDLFTQANLRGQGVGRSLIEAVYREAKLAGSPQVYWQTHETNTTAMKLYDQVAKHSGFLVYSHKI